ncbi:CTP synthase [Candidatus Saccharibacteria bacterium]|nr:CTP synthase [Candidatus Saccharibacteria bacterium]
MQEKTNTKNHSCKYIFVTGGVLSGVGKGITAASIGAILKAKGFKVTMQKCDPYLNVDAGLLNPVEHGECFVTSDGVETDLDLGHYERFLDFNTSKYSITLSGAIFKELIEKERSGGFKGKTVQLIPHFTNLVQEKIEKASKSSDIHIVEIGGTIGDYEGLSFVEAIRLFANRVGRKNCLYLSVVYVPWINTSKEFKTKPAQNALKDLRGFGIIPDIVCTRTEKPAPRAIQEKIAAFAGISSEAVVNLPDIKSVYDVPFNVLKSGVLNILNDFTNNYEEPDMKKWQTFSEKRNKSYETTIKIGLVAKYVGNEDTYMCVTEALKAASAWNEVNLELVWVNAEELEETAVVSSVLSSLDGIVVPGGFGSRGVEGKIRSADYALENNVPYLGLCLGMQVAVISACRRAGLTSANSEEFGASERDKNNVIYIMPDQKGKESTGASMRLGDYPARLEKNSKVAKIYGETKIVERHRHRYEVNKQFEKEIEKGGLKISGLSPDKTLVEFVESPNNDFFIATQAHPEFKSRPLNVHPLFLEFIKVAKSKKEKSN